MSYVGGQAVLEGVMMRGNKYIATSVRKKDGLIFTRIEELKKRNSEISKMPVIRGVENLIYSIRTGMEVMDFSVKIQEDDSSESAKSKFSTFLDRLSGGKSDQIEQTGTLLFSFLIAILVFTFIPSLITSLFSGVIKSRLMLNILEAIIKLVVFIGYILLISKVDDIDRVFRYHGAEHKVITTYENGLPLTIENVRASSRYHSRCGTNFIFLVMMVSMIIFTFIPTFNPLYRSLFKLLLIPLIAGLTFELIMWLGKSNSFLSRAISKPGRALQMITTKEPDDSMVEVAIEALKYSEGRKYTVKEAREYGLKELKEVNNPSLDRDLLLSHVIGLSRNEMIMYQDREITTEEADRYRKLIKERKTFKPVSYILGKREFMGLDFKVTEDTLIPRADTEVLVEEAEKIIKSENRKFEIIDMCTGTGAVGISLVRRNENVNALISDVSEKALEVAKFNVKNLGVDDRVEIIKSDLFEDIKTYKGFDMIVSNPPYIKRSELKTLMKDVREYEPSIALDGGEDGLDFYRRIADKARKYLKNKGSLLFEIGMTQGEDVKHMLKEYGYSDISVIKDYAGKNRVVSAKYIHDL